MRKTVFIAALALAFPLNNALALEYWTDRAAVVAYQVSSSNTKYGGNWLCMGASHFLSAPVNSERTVQGALNHCGQTRKAGNWEFIGSFGKCRIYQHTGYSSGSAFTSTAKLMRLAQEKC